MKTRRALVDIGSSLSVRRQSSLLGLCRSSLYVAPKGESTENLRVMRLMDEHHLLHPAKGVLQMQDYLSALGLVVNVKRVRRLLRLMGIEAHYPKRHLSSLGDAVYVHPYQLKGLKISYPNQVWAVDITYIPMQRGFLYLSAMIDLYSRYVVGWHLSNSLEASTQVALIQGCMDQHGKPTIVNSDQGSQYTSADWVGFLEGHRIRDGQGRATDNAFIERLWRTVKQEYVYLNPEADGRALFQGLKAYFRYYNYERTHQGIARKIPACLYQAPKE